MHSQENKISFDFSYSMELVALTLLDYHASLNFEPIPIKQCSKDETLQKQYIEYLMHPTNHFSMLYIQTAMIVMIVIQMIVSNILMQVYCYKILQMYQFQVLMVIPIMMLE